MWPRKFRPCNWYNLVYGWSFYPAIAAVAFDAVSALEERFAPGIDGTREAGFTSSKLEISQHHKGDGYTATLYSHQSISNSVPRAAGVQYPTRT